MSEEEVRDLIKQQLSIEVGVEHDNEPGSTYKELNVRLIWTRPGMKPETISESKTAF